MFSEERCIEPKVTEPCESDVVWLKRGRFVSNALTFNCQYFWMGRRTLMVK